MMKLTEDGDRISSFLDKNSLWLGRNCNSQKLNSMHWAKMGLLGRACSRFAHELPEGRSVVPPLTTEMLRREWPDVGCRRGIFHKNHLSLPVE